MNFKRQWTVLLVIVTLVGGSFPMAQAQRRTPEERALERIEEAAATEATQLNLSRLGLTELPPQIGRLTHLQELSLAENALTELPPEIGQLTSLQALVARAPGMSAVDLTKAILGIVADTVLESVRLVIDALLDVLREFAKAAIAVLDIPVHIPVVSDILNAVGVDETGS